MRTFTGYTGRGVALRVGLITAALAVAGCVGSRPPSAAASANYAGPIRSRDVDEGGRVFATLCNPCHAGRVNPRGYAWSPGQMRRQIREGNGVMPGIREEYLEDDKVEAVLAFLTVIGAVDGELPPPPAPVERATAAVTP